MPDKNNAALIWPQSGCKMMERRTDMDSETRVLIAMKLFADGYLKAGKYKKHKEAMEFIAEFEKSYFGPLSS